MSRTEIMEKLKDIVEMVTEESISQGLDENMNLIDGMGLNSVGVLYIVVGIEEVFSIRFDNVGFADFKTVGDVVTFIEQKVNA